MPVPGGPDNPVNSVYCGCQPSTCWARLLSATSSGGSPGRRGPICAGIWMARHRAGKLRSPRALLYPRPVPRFSLQSMSQLANGSSDFTCAVGQVVDVDIIANAGAVGRGIVVAKNRDLLALPERNLQHDRDQMRFGIVIFANISLGLTHRQR